MAFWTKALQVGGSLLKGIGGAKSAQAAAREKSAAEKAMALQQAQHSLESNAFNAELQDYYSQLDRKRKQRGLSQFRQFSSLGGFAPDYVEKGGIELPEKPSTVGVLSS